jgi:hypothetical protein
MMKFLACEVVNGFVKYLAFTVSHFASIYRRLTAQFWPMQLKLSKIIRACVVTLTL